MESLQTPDGWYFVSERSSTNSILFSPDGTLESATVIHRFRSQNDLPNPQPRQLTELNGRVYFLLDNQLDDGVQIYSTDGSTRQPRLETTIESSSIGLGPTQLVEFQNDLLFVTNDGLHGLELWKLPTRKNGDINDDGTINTTDIDALYAAIRDEQTDRADDLNADGNIDKDDVDFLISEVLGLCHGDTNADGTVNFQDVLVLANQFGTAGEAVGWEQGDFNGDAQVSFLDFLTIAENFGCQSET